MARWTVLFLLAGCVQSEAVLCENGKTCPAGEACDLIHSTCVDASQLTACNGLGNGDDCASAGTQSGICDRGVCIEKGCGDGYVRDEELCDGVGTPIASLDCTDLGYYESDGLVCNNVCGYDDSGCKGSCGDDVVTSPYEICEPTIAPTASCVDYGFGAGVLGCQSCGPLVTSCRSFGWQHVDIPANILAIDGTADNDVFVIGAASPINAPYAAHFDGTAWTPLSLASCITNPNVGLISISVIGPGEALAVGSNSTIVHLTATSCTPITYTRTGVRLLSVWGMSASDFYLIDETNGLMHYSSGTFTNPVNRFSASAGSVWGSGTGDVYAILDGRFIHHLSGATWTEITSSLPAFSTMYALWGTSAGNVYVAGEANVKGRVARWNGTSWSLVVDGDPLMTGVSYFGYGATRGAFTAVTGHRDTGAILALDEGTGWNSVTVPTLGFGPVWVSPSGRVMMVGTKRIFTLEALQLHSALGTESSHHLVANAADNVFATTSGALMRWNGASWESSYTGYTMVSIAPDGATYGVHQTDGLLGYDRSTNSWSVVDDTLTQNLMMAMFAISVVDANDMWMLPDDSSVSIYHRVGTTMTPISLGPDFPPLRLNDIWAASATSVFAVGSTTAVHHWDGFNWTDMPTTATTMFERIYGRTPSDVYAWTSTQLFHYDGSSWAEIVLPATSSIQGVWGTADDLFVSTSDALLRFDGAQWSPIASGTIFENLDITGVGHWLFSADASGGVQQLLRLTSW